MRQDVGNISRNIWSGRECYLLVAVVTNGHLPARDVEAQESLDLWSAGRKGQKQEDVRRPDVIRERASVEGGVWNTQFFQLALNVRLCPEHPLGLPFRVSSKLGRNEQLDVCFLRGRSDLLLDFEGLRRP